MARVLVVDDEELVRDTVVQALEGDGHEVVTANDGQEAVALFQACRADIVITDILMPNKEGIQTIGELRQLDPGVKIIAMSGGGRVKNASFLDVAKQLGAHETLKKPFQMTQLQQLVAKVLESESWSA